MTREQELLELVEKIEEPYKKLVASQVHELIFTEKRLEELKKKPFYLKNGKGETRTTATGKQYKEFSQIRDSIIRNLVKVIEKHSEKEKGAFEEWLQKQEF